MKKKIFEFEVLVDIHSISVFFSFVFLSFDVDGDGDREDDFVSFDVSIAIDCRRSIESNKTNGHDSSFYHPSAQFYP